jgi:hypothetical protein
MLPGTIMSNDGKMLSFEIERGHRSGKVTAFDPSDDERFVGSYVAIVNGVSSTAYSPLAGFGVERLTSNVANAQALLHGDKGSILNCDMQIEAGFFPHGIGTCVDNHAKGYRLQF